MVCGERCSARERPWGAYRRPRADAARRSATVHVHELSSNLIGVHATTTYKFEAPFASVFTVQVFTSGAAGPPSADVYPRESLGMR